MRHHTTSIVGPDLDGNEQASWAKMFPYHTTPVKDAPPAQPSVGENVMRAIHVASGWSGVELTQSLRDTLRPMALAVRREVLSEPFTDEDVKAADKAFMAFRGGGRTDWIRAALSAALASRVKRAEREDKQ